MYNPHKTSSPYDIALVKLSEKLDFSKKHSHISPICLPNRNEEVNENSKCQAVGWGKTSSNSKPSSVLKYVDQNIINKKKCKKAYPDLTNKHICANHHGETTCNGDSGGPLECMRQDGSWVLQGITSFGNVKCGDSPSVFSKVSKHLKWIHRIRARH